jgi:hypothetical protein
MSRLEVQVLLGEHFGALDGEDGRVSLKKAIGEALAERS